ncbi:CLAVATA3/ESR [Hirschfeldia incana]|nr:CLAVATA3/ESR [Hirschfeldia incana]
MGCRDVRLTFSVALLLIFLFQVWLFREGQVRELSEDNHLGRDKNTLVSNKKKDDDDVQRLFQRYFKGPCFGLNNNSNTRFEDSDRKIPSSPDRLHN